MTWRVIQNDQPKIQQCFKMANKIIGRDAASLLLSATQQLLSGLPGSLAFLLVVKGCD